jgi:hypothetical protein
MGVVMLAAPRRNGNPYGAIVPSLSSGRKLTLAEATKQAALDTLYNHDILKD